MPARDFADSVDKLTSNTIDIAVNLYGQSGLDYIAKMVKKHSIHD